MSIRQNPFGRLALAASIVISVGLAPSAFASNETVALKNALYGAGYDVTNVNPQMDDGTRSALNAFQKDAGLQATGALNEETKKALGMISVQVAAVAAPASTSTAEAGATQPSAPTEAEAPQDGAIEEDEDGGWSLW